MLDYNEDDEHVRSALTAPFEVMHFYLKFALSEPQLTSAAREATASAEDGEVDDVDDGEVKDDSDDEIDEETIKRKIAEHQAKVRREQLGEPPPVGFPAHSHQ